MKLLARFRCVFCACALLTVSVIATFVVLTNSTVHAAAAVYYVSPTGSDSGPGTQGQPFRTISRGASALMPGDTLRVRPGTYVEHLENNIPSGLDWSRPVTIMADDPSNRPVIIAPTSGAYRVLSFSGQSYIIISDLVLDGNSDGANGRGVLDNTVKITDHSHHIRMQNCEVKNALDNGLVISTADFNEVIGCEVHHNGVLYGAGHGIYITGSDNVVDHTASHDNAEYGVHSYDESTPSHCNRNTIKFSKLYNNGRAGARNGGGFGLFSGDGHTAFNNLVYGNIRGIVIDYGASNAQVYNNTVYGNTYNGYEALYNGAGSSRAVIRNNIVYANTVNGIANVGGATADHNITVNPSFVNAAAGDFHLKSGSPAIDAGMTLPQVSTDMDNTPRPQGASGDPGAYEYSTGSAQTPPSRPATPRQIG